MTTKLDLQKQGYKPVPDFAGLYISKAGQVYDYRRKRLLSSRPKNRVAYDGRLLSVPKLLLSAFGKQPYNNRRHIRHINGDKTNIATGNICYTPDRSTMRINYADLHTAVLCYFEVPKKYRLNDRVRTKQYLSDIVRRRGFLCENGDRKGIEIFREYLDNPFASLNSIADQYGIPVRLCTEIINPLLNDLIRDIMAEYRAGSLQIRDFRPRRKTRKKSKKQILKDWNEHLTELQNKHENHRDSL